MNTDRYFKPISESSPMLEPYDIQSVCHRDDCQRHHDYCPDCFDGDMYLSPDVDIDYELAVGDLEPRFKS